MMPVTYSLQAKEVLSSRLFPKKFFKHVAPYMDFMKQELLNQRPPANIMDAIREGKFK